MLRNMLRGYRSPSLGSWGEEHFKRTAAEQRQKIGGMREKVKITERTVR